MHVGSGKNAAIKQLTERIFDTRDGTFSSGSGGSGKQCGFTMIELITVIVIVGVLAVVVAPRLFDASIFQSRGFADQVQATLRYAQKVAIAQRRYVCVAFSTNSITLTTGTTAACGTNLAPLSGAGPAFITAAPASITFMALPANFYFNSLGVPSISQTINITGATNGITIEAQTGYVHSP